MKEILEQNTGAIGFLMACAGLGMVLDKFQLVFGIGLFVSGGITFWVNFMKED